MVEERANAEVYSNLRTQTIELVTSLSPDQVALRVVQSPDWSIKDVVAHVTGIIADILSDNLDGIGSDHWTETQVTSRADLALEEVCAEWAASAPEFAALGAANPVMPMRACADLVTHYHDILQTLQRPGERDTDAVRLGLERYGPYFCERTDAAGLPLVRVDAGAQVWQSGDGEPDAVVTASAFELLRAFSGRRSTAQIRAMNWTGDAEPYLAVVSPYGLPDKDVIE